MRRRGMGRPRHYRARRLRARRASREWQQRDVARPLDGHAQPALVPGANARHSPRQYLSALLHELREDVRALVVDEVHLLSAELAHLLLAEILALASGPASGPPRSARTASPRAAFAPRTTVPAARTAVTATVAAFTPRSSSRRCCLFRFLCHTFHPFTRRPGLAGNKPFMIPVKPESLCWKQKNLSPRRPSSSQRPAPEPLPQEREPVLAADAAPRASRASVKVFSGASNLHPDERSGT